MKSVLLLIISFNLSALAELYDSSKIMFDGIPVRISYQPSNDKLNQEIWTYLDSLDTIFNDYNSSSEVSLLNGKTSLKNQLVSEGLADAIRKSQQLYAMTDGAFDISIKPLIELWELAESLNVYPSAELIKSTLSTCSLKNLTVEGRTLNSAHQLQMSFGGIVKGVAVDHIMSLLKKNHCQSALIQIGGETSCFGIKPDKSDYKLAIAHPLKTGEFYQLLRTPAHGLSISSSSNLHRSITIQNKELHHIINPKTGWPAITNILSVSIAFHEPNKNWLCDALSTAAIIMGPKKTAEVINALKGDYLFLVESDGKVQEIKSSAWSSLIL